MLLIFLILSYLLQLSSHSVDYLLIKDCKRGKFLFDLRDNDVSTHLNLYGEWNDAALSVLLQMIQPGDSVVDIGANLGAFVVPFSERVGKYGVVHAFESEKLFYQLLMANLALNGILNVKSYQKRVSNSVGVVNVPFSKNIVVEMFPELQYRETIEHIKLDDVNFTNPFSDLNCPKIIRVDANNLESEVLLGGIELIKRCQPLLYVRNTCLKNSKDLIDLLYSLDYIPHWDVLDTYSRNNYFNNGVNWYLGKFTVYLFALPLWALFNAEAGTGIHMAGYAVVNQSMPYLHLYFNGIYGQSGDFSSCDTYSQYTKYS